MNERSALALFLVSIMIASGYSMGSMQFSRAQIGTQVGGSIDSDTTWARANSPYILRGAVSVWVGVVLTIESGTTVDLNGNNLTVIGTLTAKGTEVDKTVFNGGDRTNGVTMMGASIISNSVFNGKITAGDTSTIANNVINGRIEIINGAVKISNNTINGIPPEGADKLVNDLVNGYQAPGNVVTGEVNTGIFLKNEVAEAQITDNTISNCAAGIKVYSPGNITIQGNIIKENIVNGIEIYSAANLRIKSNIFSHNVGDAIIDQGDKASLIIQGNAFVYEPSDMRQGIYNSMFGISLHGNKNPYISDNLIQGCIFGIGNGAGTIERNLFTQNSDPVDLQYQVPSIVQNNSFINNSRGISDPSSASTIIYNNIVNSSQTGSIWMTNPGDVNATYNWWGTTDPQLISQGIYTNGFGTVTYIPFLNESNPQATPRSSLPAIDFPTPQPTSPPPTPTGPPAPTPSPTALPQTTPLLSISCRSSTSSTNFRVDIDGRLTANGSGLTEAAVLLSYSIDGGSSWNQLTLVKTTGDGTFAATWMPSVSGSFSIKALWAGDSAYSGTSNIVNFVIEPLDERSVFSVSSNSTLFGLFFDSANKQLSFNVTGSPGTTGYADIYLPKTLISEASSLKVYLDGNPLPYSAQLQGDAWLVSFTYHHSTHRITMDLGTGSSTTQTINPLVEWTIVGGVLTAVAITAVYLVLRRKRRKS